MKFPSFHKKSVPISQNNDSLSDFLHNASHEEKIALYTKVAHMANKDQQDLVKRSEALQSA